MENIIIKDSFSSSKSKIIYAKKGYFSENNNENFLFLLNCKILNINDGRTNSFDFNETQINLSKYTSKTTKTPKIQEVNTKNLFQCFFKGEINTIRQSNLNDSLIFICDNSLALKNRISQELFSRIFKPFYIPLLALIGSLLLIKSKNSQGFSNYKFKVFALGVIAISASEITTKFYSASFNESFFIIMTPFILFSLLYFFIKKQFRLNII